MLFFFIELYTFFVYLFDKMNYVTEKMNKKNCLVRSSIVQHSIVSPFRWHHYFLLLNKIKVSLKRNGVLFKGITFKMLNRSREI